MSRRGSDNNTSQITRPHRRQSRDKVWGREVTAHAGEETNGTDSSAVELTASSRLQRWYHYHHPYDEGHRHLYTKGIIIFTLMTNDLAFIALMMAIRDCRPLLIGGNYCAIPFIF